MNVGYPEYLHLSAGSSTYLGFSLTYCLLALTSRLKPSHTPFWRRCKDVCSQGQVDLGRRAYELASSTGCRDGKSILRMWLVSPRDFAESFLGNGM